MSWHGNRHSGGVRGTRLARADCPVCGRDTAGGNNNRDRTEIRLKTHRDVRGSQRRGNFRPWCSGSGMVVRWR